MNFPAELKYSFEHTWIKPEGDTATVGITEFAQSELGEIVYVDLPTAGTIFPQNGVFGSVEALKTVSDLFMPASGEIIELNPRLKQEPMLVNSDPYGDGWMIKIRLHNQEELNNLLSATDYQHRVDA